MRVSVGRKVDVVYKWMEGRPVLMEGEGKVLTHIGGDSTEDSGQGGGFYLCACFCRRREEWPIL